MLNAKTPIVFDPQPSDTYLADFERAIAEGWYCLEALSVGETSRKTCALSISAALDRAAGFGDESYNQEEENPFIVPSSAIGGLRVSLRSVLALYDLLGKPPTPARNRKAEDALRSALLAIGNALVTIELPE